MNQEIKEIIVSREDAVFWMDGNGRWHNEHGPFEHPKIIDYFHTAIRKDAGGYYLTQEYNNIREKVYFPYQETALFVFDVIKGDTMTLLLNTKKKVPLSPDDLFIRNDQLFMWFEDDCLKFSDHALTRVSDCIDEVDGQTVFQMGDCTNVIAEED